MPITLLEMVLAPLLILLAWQILRVKDLFMAIVLFIVFGLFMAIAWVGMQAPDIALVEAAIGSGLAGALFLGSLGRIESMNTKRNVASVLILNKRLFLKLAVQSLIFSAGFILIRGMLTLSGVTAGLGDQVRAALPESGVTNPVTAVILNFRAFDTFLEIGVLLLAILAVYVLVIGENDWGSFSALQPSRVLVMFLKILVPLMILVAGYLLWAGAHDPGGAFQAGAILAAAGILLLLGGVKLPLSYQNAGQRFFLAFGFLGFGAAGILTIVGGRRFLEFPTGMAKYFILAIEGMAMISIAYILLSLFAGCAGYLGSGNSLDRKLEKRETVG